jgi:nitrate reductase (cytochrome), electron transfer subunit
MKVPAALLDLCKLALAAAVFAFGLHLANAQNAPAKPAAKPAPVGVTTIPQAAATPDEGPVKLQSLRAGTPLDQDLPATVYKQERDGPVADRDFVQMPPLIPHTISGYQVTKNFNKCMDCHAWQKTRESGATKISVTHFKTREGIELDSVSPLRYFCTSCHVAQSDAKPLVGNSYQRAQGLR